ncbi:winged helix-turn-helix domain-containing protein, partial [Streptomyces cavourensis]
AVAPMAQALVEAAAWVGCTDIRLERIDAPELRDPLRDEIGRALQRAYR